MRRVREPKTLQDAVVYFAEVENCIHYLAEKRWPDGVVMCPVCGRTGASYVEARKVWQCKTRHPKAQFSIKVGTIFEDSPIPLGKWLTAMWMVANCKNGVSSHEISRALGVTQKTAWFLNHRIRLALGEDRPQMLGEGPVEVDETFIGGKVSNMHMKKRERLTAERGRGTAGKTIVMGMLDRELRKVRAQIVPNVERDTLQNEILAKIQKRSTVYTDSWGGYRTLAEKEFVHDTVNHMIEYVRGQVHTQGIENFWSLLKRGLTGTYVAVEPFHLHRYLDEQMFRYNNRATRDNPLNDSDRFALAVSQIVGKRITYAELTGKVQETTEPF